jgi:1-aminocyclopropane-1-carboxylate synthase
LTTCSITIDDLDNAYNNAISKGHPPKAIIITNPNNPLGKIYTKNELLIFINYCNMKSIHLIVDEIYALSVFDNDVNNDDKFQSVTTILENKLNDNVHVIWGLSKDFGVSGLRAGFLYTQNKLLLASLSNFNMAFEVSNIVQEIYEDILSDHAFIKDYLALNSKLIQESYVLLTTGLNKLKIPFFHCHAGIFLFVDMSHLLKGNLITTATTTTLFYY